MDQINTNTSGFGVYFFTPGLDDKKNARTMTTSLQHQQKTNLTPLAGMKINRSKPSIAEM
jgi:hypothetical protein